MRFAVLGTEAPQRSSLAGTGPSLPLPASGSGARSQGRAALPGQAARSQEAVQRTLHTAWKAGSAGRDVKGQTRAAAFPEDFLGVDDVPIPVKTERAPWLSLTAHDHTPSHGRRQQGHLVSASAVPPASGL